MAEVTINYKDAAIATMDASGTKTLQTQGKYCEDDIEVVYVKPSGGGGDMYKLIDGTITDADVDWSLVTAPRDSAFMKCRSLTRVNNPVMPAAPENLFWGCSGLITAEISYTIFNPQYLNSTFRGCTSLRSATTHLLHSGTPQPYINFTDVYGMRDCTNLETYIIDVPNVTDLRFNPNSMFWNCKAFRTLVIKMDGVATLSAAFNASNFGGIYNNPTVSTVYVYRDYIEQYQQATTWSTMYAAGVTFAPIEGSIYDT